MKRLMVLCLATFAICGLAQAAEDPDAYKIHVYGWSYGRERKTVTSSNRVTANFQIKNVSKSDVTDVHLTLAYSTGLGEKVAEPLKQKVGALKAGESKKIAIVGDFIPVFGAYNILVEYNGKEKEEWFANSDIGQPEPKNGQPIEGVANVMVLGQEAGNNRSGRFSGTVRVKNEGTVEAKNVKITVNFFDAKKKKIGEWSGKLGNGTLPGGAEENIPFAATNNPRTYASYEIKVGCEDTSAEAALAGGEFTNVEDVEFAKFAFKRADPKSPELQVSAQVRNGFKVPVDQAKLTLVFYGVKKKELKRFTFEVPGSLNAGEIKPVQFSIKELPQYDSFEQQVGYNKLNPNAPKQADTKVAPAKFKNIADVEVIFTDSATNDDKSVSIVASTRNGKSTAVKDITVTVTFTRPDGSTFDGEKVLSDVVEPGEVRNFVIMTPNAAGFASYAFKFKYSEANAQAAAQPVSNEELENKAGEAVQRALGAIGKE